MLSACIHSPTAGQPRSLALAKWISSENYRGCDDVRNEDGTADICIRSLADVRLDIVETITGPKLPNSVVTTALVHTDPSVRLVVVAVGAEADGFQMAVVDFVRPGDKEACIEATAVLEHKITVPSAAIRGKKEYCFPISNSGGR